MKVPVTIEKGGKPTLRVDVEVSKPGDLAQGVHDAIVEWHKQNPDKTLLEGDVNIRIG